MKESRTYRQAATGLKICPVCSALNREISMQCYNCLWHGEFEIDADHVIVVLREVGSELGLTEEETTKCCGRKHREQQGMSARLKSGLSQMMRSLYSKLAHKHSVCS